MRFSGLTATFSDDVHFFITLAAKTAARKLGGQMGARTFAEAYGYFLTEYRRRLSFTAIRAFVRHRIRRVPYVGVPREVLLARPNAVQVHVPAEPPEAFFAHQQWHAQRPVMAALVAVQ